MYRRILPVFILSLLLIACGSQQASELSFVKKTPGFASRGEVRGIRLSKTYVPGDRIPVFVEYHGPAEEGFESARYFCAQEYRSYRGDQMIVVNEGV
jgi:hypothetical protein